MSNSSFPVVTVEYPVQKTGQQTTELTNFEPPPYLNTGQGDGPPTALGHLRNFLRTHSTAFSAAASVAFFLYVYSYLPFQSVKPSLVIGLLGFFAFRIALKSKNLVEGVGLLILYFFVVFFFAGCFFAVIASTPRGASLFCDTAMKVQPHAQAVANKTYDDVDGVLASVLASAFDTEPVKKEVKPVTEKKEAIEQQAPVVAPPVEQTPPPKPSIVSPRQKRGK